MIMLDVLSEGGSEQGEVKILDVQSEGVCKRKSKYDMLKYCMKYQEVVKKNIG